MSNIAYELNQKIHAIILNPYLSCEEFNKNCDLIKKYNIKNVSTSLNFLKHVKNTLNNTVKINAFADLPIDFLDEFICYAKDGGAGGIEYTPNFFNLSNNFFCETEIIPSFVNSKLAANIPAIPVLFILFFL